MAKIAVCFYCDREVLQDGAPGEEIPVETQVGLFRQRRLESVICFVCFRHGYKEIRRNLRAILALMKKEALAE